MIIIVDELVHPALNVVSALDALAQCIDSFYIMSFSHYYLDTFICYSKMRPIHAPIMRQFICTKNKLKPFYTKKIKYIITWDLWLLLLLCTSTESFIDLFLLLI
jgi:hypothetical protein